MGNIVKIDTGHMEKVLNELTQEMMSKKFKLTDNYQQNYEAHINELQTESDNLAKNGQSNEKELAFLENTKKIIEILKENTQAVGVEKFKQISKDNDTYLYAILLTLTKNNIVESV